MIIKVNDIKTDLWLDLFQKSEYSSPFQTPEFFKFFKSLNDFSADVFGVEEREELTSLMVVTIQKEKGIKGFFSRRGIIYGGPVLKNKSEASINFLLKSVINYYSSKLIYLEVRSYFDFSSVHDSILDSGFEFVPWLNFHLDITTPELMLKSMSSSRARQIKKVIKSEVKWQEAQSEKDVNSFYEILEDLYVNKIKKPIFPKQFFLDFYLQNVGKYLLIYFEEKVIGGIMCPILEGKSIYEFYVCGLDTEYKDQYPSVMATWAAMEYASINNIPLFDFMGAGSPHEDYGVREFKSRFGGRQVEYGRYIKVLNPILFQIGKIGLKIIQKIR
ncbi:MAG TPA: GNAT family N-acetyltransferase [Bacteroidetes bacterium]|nr:GNAT family N-acetyltransferase [Bacteroidota bacterium]